jgi:hypothetical protein
VPENKKSLGKNSARARICKRIRNNGTEVKLKNYTFYGGKSIIKQGSTFHSLPTAAMLIAGWKCFDQ